MSVSQPRPFRGSRWFKGNLHAHTELSDGALSPARVVEIYKKHNYDFLAVTDHDPVSYTQLDVYKRQPLA